MNSGIAVIIVSGRNSDISGFNGSHNGPLKEVVDAMHVVN